MSKYGILLANENEDLYRDISTYFNNPKLTKVKDSTINDNHFSIYVCKISNCLLVNLCRYLVVMCKRDELPIGSIKSLRHIEWDIFQTRTLNSEYFGYPDINFHSYSNRQRLGYPIVRKNIMDDVSVYEMIPEKYPIVIKLLHTPKNTSLVYKDNGDLGAALETYETIITFNNN